MGRVEFARDARLAERHEHFPVLIELDDGVTLAVLAPGVGHPHVAFTVHVNAVWKDEQAGAEALQVLAGGIELDDRRDARPGAGIAAAALEDPDLPWRVADEYKSR